MRVVGEIANERFKEMKELIDKKYYLNQSDFVRQAVLNELSKMKEHSKRGYDNGYEKNWLHWNRGYGLKYREASTKCRS